MNSSVFKFKNFSVVQNKCAMKVNTDGVLLGAWTNAESATSILDIGTGTGVIALMMAQKNSTALIDAIDIDEDSYLQAKENFSNTVWCKRLNAHFTSLQNFNPSKKYDLIISNPPYFRNDLKTPNAQKNIAKHSAALSYEELLSGVNHLLSEDGKAFLVIPSFNYNVLTSIAEKENLFTANALEVIAVTDKNPYLILVELRRTVQTIFKNSIVIKDTEGNFTPEYIKLTKEFYLKF